MSQFTNLWMRVLGGILIIMLLISIGLTVVALYFTVSNLMIAILPGTISLAILTLALIAFILVLIVAIPSARRL